ncbi:MAG TPA: DUF6443 domain-containing protein [Chryseolinea sp.]
MKMLFKFTLCLSLVFQLGQAYAQCNFDGTLTMTSGCNGNNTVTLRVCSPPYPLQFDTYTLIGDNGRTYVGTYGAVPNGSCNVMVTWRGVTDGFYTYKLNTNAPCSNWTVTVTSLPETGGITLNASRSPQICQGESITLTAAGGTNYHWSSSAGDSWNGGSISVSPQVSTSYTVTGTPFGCSAPGSETTSIPVSVTPTVGPVTITSGTFERCQGEGQSIFGGSTAANALTYEWDLSPETAGSRVGGVITWSSAFSGTAKVTYKAKGCGTSSDEKDVTVHPPPDVTLSPSGNLQVPLGTFQTDLSAPFNNTYNYKWSSDAINYSWVTGNVFTVKESGSYKVKITTPEGCSATSLATNVIISKDRNYIIERNVQIDKKTNELPVEESDVPSLAIGDKTESYTFFDGIGRPLQTVATGVSTGHNDVVQPIVYDVYGRETMKYLPYTSSVNPGWFKEKPVGIASAQYAFYNQPNSTIAQDEPYAQTIVEPSPLNRVLKQGAPGAAWQPNSDAYSLEDKTIKKGYWNNSIDDEVLFFTYDPQTDALSAGDAASFDYYDPNALAANKTTDENKNEVIEFIDKQGRTICKKVQSGTQNGVKQYASTYYIYDDKDKLILVLPPEAIVEILKQH